MRVGWEGRIWLGERITPAVRARGAGRWDVLTGDGQPYARITLSQDPMAVAVDRLLQNASGTMDEQLLVSYGIVEANPGER